MWPTEARTLYPGPRYLPIVLALAGDSTMTSRFFRLCSAMSPDPRCGRRGRVPRRPSVIAVVVVPPGVPRTVAAGDPGDLLRDLVGVAAIHVHHHVGQAVERLALGQQEARPRERVGPREQRPVGPGAHRAPDGFLGRNPQPDQQGSGRELLEQPGLRDPAAAGREHDVVEVAALGRQLGLERPEGRLAHAPEYIRDGKAGTPLDLLVEVEEVPAEALGEPLTDSGLAGGHEADEHDPADRRRGLSPPRTAPLHRPLPHPGPARGSR